MITKLDSNNHSVFLLYYHLVWVTKYRRKVLNDEISDYLKDHFIRIHIESQGINNPI
jgi:putative transposase